MGSLVWGSLTLGLLSISTASFKLLLAWFVGQTIELAIAGAVVGSGLAGGRLRRLFGVVIAGVMLSVIATIGLQSFGLVPTMQIE